MCRSPIDHRLLTLVLVVPVLAGIHHSPPLVLAACSCLAVIATYLQTSLTQVSMCSLYCLCSLYLSVDRVDYSDCV